MDAKRRGAFIAERRKELGMTQEMLARQLHVTDKAVSRWEQGTAMPDIENLIAMSDLFGMSLDELLKGQAGQTEAADSEEDEASQDDAPKDVASPIFDRLVNWLRADVISAAIGLAMIINGAFYGYVFDKKLVIFTRIGIALLLLSAVLAVILFFAFRALKKKYD